jgi:alkylhydroperoxidase family enzyme
VDIWDAIQANVRIVPGLDQLDPITSELVRLRCARAHNCRICKSLRSLTAFEAGADDATFDAVDRYEQSDFSDATKAALALVDAMVWTPGRVPDAVVDGVRAGFSAAQQVELVLDVARHATNKFAVSMAVDTPHVEDGYEVYLVAPDGSTTYGLDRP